MLPFMLVSFSSQLNGVLQEILSHLRYHVLYRPSIYFKILTIYVLYISYIINFDLCDFIFLQKCCQLQSSCTHKQGLYTNCKAWESFTGIETSFDNSSRYPVFYMHVNLCFLYFCPFYLHCQSPNLRLGEFIFEYSKIVCVQIQNIYHNSLHIHVCVNNRKGKNTLYTVVDSPHGIS